MGYSISVRCGDAPTKRKLLGFLQTNFRPITDVLAHLGFGSQGYPPLTNALKAGDKALVSIGGRVHSALVQSVTGQGWRTVYDVILRPCAQNEGAEIAPEASSAGFTTSISQTDVEPPFELPMWHGLCPPDLYAVRRPTDDLSYPARGGGVGFDYSCLSGIERAYLFSVVSWAAISVGRRVCARPCFYYDSSRVFLNIDGQPEPEARNCDALGWAPCSEQDVFAPFLVQGGPSLASLNDAARNEILRLDGLWTDWKAPKKNTALAGDVSSRGA